MRQIFLATACLLISSVSYGQAQPSEIFKKMDGLYDQFNKAIEVDDISGEITLIYIPGNDNPFGKVYDRHKGVKFKQEVQFIGGFAEMMNAMSKEAKKKHLQDAFQSRYGKQHFTILLDLDSDVQKVLGNKGYAIVKISSDGKRVISNQDFGGDRAAFFQALKPLKQ